MDEVAANKQIPVLVSPDKDSRAAPKRLLSGGRARWLRAVLASQPGSERYGN